jgi:WXG100 family type VII secretion target
MADKVTLSYDGLATQAKTVLNQKKEYDALMKKIMNTATTLNSIWEDSAAKDFADKVKSMQKTFDAFGDALEQIGTHMNKVSESYTKLSTEIKNAQKGF